jgi:hypothetical protein
MCESLRFLIQSTQDILLGAESCSERNLGHAQRWSWSLGCAQTYGTIFCVSVNLIEHTCGARRRDLALGEATQIIRHIAKSSKHRRVGNG